MTPLLSLHLTLALVWLVLLFSSVTGNPGRLFFVFEAVLSELQPGEELLTVVVGTGDHLLHLDFGRGLVDLHWLWYIKSWNAFHLETDHNWIFGIFSVFVESNIDLVALGVNFEREVLEDPPGEFFVRWILTPLDPGEDRDGFVGHAGQHRLAHRALPARSGLVQATTQHVYPLGPAEDAEHDLPVGVLVVELPAGGTQADRGVAGVVAVELVSEGVTILPVSVSVRDKDTKLEHLLREVLLVVAERTLEEVRARVLCSECHALPVEPSSAARSPEELLTLPVIQRHRAAPALLPHLHLRPVLLLVVEGGLQRLVDRTEGFELSVELLETAVLETTRQVVSFPGRETNIENIFHRKKTTRRDLLAASLPTAQGGVLLLAIDTLQLTPSPPLLHDVLHPEAVDPLVVLPPLVEVGGEHEAEEVSSAVPELVESPQSELAARRLGWPVAKLADRLSLGVRNLAENEAVGVDLITLRL